MTFKQLYRMYAGDMVDVLPECKDGYILNAESKIRFKAITKILKSFYGVLTNDNLLRYRILELPVTDYTIGIGVMKKHEYLIIVMYGDEFDFYIHIDGIQQERELATDKSHPVFKVDCLTDILVDNTKTIEYAEKDSKVIDNW